MMSKKREQRYTRIEESKERLKTMPTEAIKKTLSQRVLTKEGAIAYREVLEEREKENPEAPQD
jgi:hypothetical protein